MCIYFSFLFYLSIIFSQVFPHSFYEWGTVPGVRSTSENKTMKTSFPALLDLYSCGNWIWNWDTEVQANEQGEANGSWRKRMSQPATSPPVSSRHKADKGGHVVGNRQVAMPSTAQRLWRSDQVKDFMSGSHWHLRSRAWPENLVQTWVQVQEMCGEVERILRSREQRDFNFLIGFLFMQGNQLNLFAICLLPSSFFQYLGVPLKPGSDWAVLINYWLSANGSPIRMSGGKHQSHSSHFFKINRLF